MNNSYNESHLGHYIVFLVNITEKPSLTIQPANVHGKGDLSIEVQFINRYHLGGAGKP